MSIKAKLVILELVAGAFGWGWLIAGGVAIYYLVMAIGFDGSWASFFIALVIGGIAKWLARGFEDSKRRVAFEADLVAKGMSPEQAGEAWIQAYTGQGVSKAVAADPQTRAMSEENHRKAEERLQIVSDFGEFVERNPTATDIWDVKFLPHDKETILDAICMEIIREENETRLEALKTCALILADFQEDIGDKPLSQIGVDVASIDSASIKDDDLMALAGQIAGNSGKERYETLQPIVQENQREILAKLMAAEQMRRDMPEDQKREILGWAMPLSTRDQQQVQQMVEAASAENRREMRAEAEATLAQVNALMGQLLLSKDDSKAGEIAINHLVTKNIMKQKVESQVRSTLTWLP